MIQHVRRYLADVRTLHVDDACIRAQFPVELSISHINRIDLDRAILQHTVRKSARGRTDVCCRPPRKANTERSDPLCKLQSAAADIRKILSHDAQYCIGGNGCARFIHTLLVDEHLSCHNETLRTLTARCKPLYGEQHIQTLFLQRCPLLLPIHEIGHQLTQEICLRAEITERRARILHRLCCKFLRLIERGQ